MAQGVHRPKQPQLVRAKLLAAGAQLLSDGASLSIGTVAESAGVTKGAVQHHFGTREELMLAIYDELEAEFAEAVADDGSGASAAWRYAKASLEMHKSPAGSERWRALLIASVVEPALSARWSSWVKADRQQDAQGSTKELLARLAADGLWLSDALGIYKFSEAERDALAKEIQKLTKGEN